MGNISNLLHQALVAWLNKRGIAAVEVTGLEQDTRTGGYCESCYYEEVVIQVTYRTAEDAGVFEYRGDMGELIRELDDVS